MSLRQERILIVDDEKTVRRILQDKLSSHGYLCQEASSAEEALEKLRNEAYAAVILDIRMPGKSGMELLPDLRANFPDTAVIMATAVADATAAIQCMKQGAYDYITKPFSLDEIILGVGRAVEKRRLELENRDYQLHLEQKVKEQAREIRASFLNAVTALANALEAKDRYTAGHSQRVADISVAIAQQLGMNEDAIPKIRLAALVHDIGKIGMRESVLNKPTGLAYGEYEHVKRHSEIGKHILAPIAQEQVILDIVRHHHEHYDGSGYPEGLAGEQIPLTARILAVADSYDAMTSERAYRRAMSSEAARAEIEQCSGTQFDPIVVEAFLKVRETSREVGK